MTSATQFPQRPGASGTEVWPQRPTASTSSEKVSFSIPETKPRPDTYHPSDPREQKSESEWETEPSSLRREETPWRDEETPREVPRDARQVESGAADVEPTVEEVTEGRDVPEADKATGEAQPKQATSRPSTGPTDATVSKDEGLVTDSAVALTGEVVENGLTATLDPTASLPATPAAVTAEAPTVLPAPTVPTPAPASTNARAAARSTRATSTSPANGGSSAAANPAALLNPSSAVAKPVGLMTTGADTHSSTIQQLSGIRPADGTANALQAVPMATATQEAPTRSSTQRRDSAEPSGVRVQSGGVFGSVRASQSPTPLTPSGRQESGGERRRDPSMSPRPEATHTIGASQADGPASASSSPTQSVQASAELSPMVLQHLERMRRLGRSWMRLSLKGKGGEPLDLRLGLKGDRVSITIYSGDAGLQEDLVRSWPRMADLARRRGLTLTEPRFALEAMATGSRPQTL